MSITKIHTDELRRMNGREGLVLQGCGGDLSEWQDGINELLTEAGILLDNTRFDNIYVFQRESVQNILFPFDGDTKLDMGNLQRDYCVDHEPALVNAFTNRVRKALQDLGLFDSSHCEPEQDGQLDYEGKVLVLKSHVLKDQYKTPDNQLFFAESGFGCAPNARGRKVYGRFLKDGEETHFNRQEFIGILKDEHLPEWAVEKLRELYPPEEEDSGMTMQ